jgi:hypothetical protein
MKRQVVRQLTVASLNCAISNCDDYQTGLIAMCNDACAGDMAADYNMCVDQLDCFNNGGTWDEFAGCLFPGICAGPTAPLETACEMDSDCGEGNYCEPDNCHTRDLCPEDGKICWEPLGPASSPRKCNAARKNDTFVP